MTMQESLLLMVFGMFFIGVIGLFIYMAYVSSERRKKYDRMEEDRYWTNRRKELFP